MASTSTSADSLADVLAIQQQQHVLISDGRDSSASGATTTRLNVSLVNATTSNTVYAFITGLAINNNNAVWLLEADGKTDYFPSNPSAVGTALSTNCAIPLPAPGDAVTVSIPQVAGGRIWFSIGTPLTFLLNPGATGAALVEPSVTNGSDPNINLTWDFCEFTYNSSQMFANITYVDFVCLPIALDIAGTDGTATHVSGMPTTGLNSVCEALEAQAAADGSDWDQLVVKDSAGNNLRAISPNNAIILDSSRFANYYESYVNSAWSKYTSATLNIDTQASYGIVEGTVSGSSLTFPGGISFAKPSTADIFSCSSGPFQTGSNGEVNAIIPRLAAAFNRSTVLSDANQPDDELVSDYYQTSPTNYYSKICHENNLDNLGYGFPYDDVAPSSLVGVSGAVADGSPTLLTVTVGGIGAHSTATKRKSRVRRNVEFVKQPRGYLMESMSDEKAMFKSSEMIDLERGEKFSGNLEQRRPLALRNAMPPLLKRFYEKMAPQLNPVLDNVYVRKVFDLLNLAMTSILSASARALASRIILAVLVLLFYMTIELFNKTMQTAREVAPQQ